MWGMEDRPYNSGGNYGSAPPIHRFAQTDAEAEYDPGYAQVDAEAEMAPHTHHALMHMYCLRNPNAA